MSISNGMARTRDGETMYYVDGSTHGVDAFRHRSDPDQLDLDELVVTSTRSGPNPAQPAAWPL